MNIFLRSLSVGYFIAVRQVKRTNKWMNLLTIFIMMITFLNLVGTSGFLVGIVVGSQKAFKDQWMGDVLITNLVSEDEILRTPDIENIVRTTPSVRAYSPRLTRLAMTEADWETRKDQSLGNSLSAVVAGIVPTQEEETTNLSKYLVEGSWLDDTDKRGVIVGSGLLKEYSSVGDITKLLKDVHPGKTIRIAVGSSTQDFIVRGIIKSKVDFVSNRMYINQSELRKMIDKHDFNVTEIAVKVYDGKDPYDVKGPLMQNGFSEYARINTASEGWPEFLVNIKKFFMVVGDILGGASVVVSLVTIFIIIYINALTRRRQIGILKGIGISPLALEFSYIFQAFFYVFIGTVLALLIIFVGIKPYLDAHPIITPFADIVLVADLPAVIGKCLLVILATLFSALFPARVIIKQNTLNAILGRN